MLLSNGFKWKKSDDSINTSFRISIAVTIFLNIYINLNRMCSHCSGSLGNIHFNDIHLFPLTLLTYFDQPRQNTSHPYTLLIKISIKFSAIEFNWTPSNKMDSGCCVFVSGNNIVCAGPQFECLSFNKTEDINRVDFSLLLVCGNRVCLGHFIDG